MDEEKLSDAAKRYRTLVRAVNIRRGMRRQDDRPPENHWKNGSLNWRKNCWMAITS